MINLIETFSLSLFLRSRIQVKKVNLINIDMMTDCSVVFVYGFGWEGGTGNMCESESGGLMLKFLLRFVPK